MGTFRPGLPGLFRRSASVILVTSVLVASGWAADEIPSIPTKTAAMERLEGFFDFYWDEAKGKVWLEVSRFDQEFLYVNSLSRGLGSNPVGLDRGQLGSERVVRFSRMGPKVLLIEGNLRYRALSDNENEKRAVRESFAQSVLWGATVAAADGSVVLVDATDFLLRDAQGVIGTLKATRQGQYSLDKSRSALYRPRTKNFPKNTEFDALLTFGTTGNPGRLVREVTPSPDSITLHQHHSFIELPDADFEVRQHHARISAIPIVFADYAAPLDAPLEKRYILRHRLKKKNPGSAVSEPVSPIVYYVDSGAPRQVRDALIDGASWWNQAFEAAGFRNAFRVEVFPDGADPMDVRYNVIQWVHRSTRGWSYGSSITDPRSGEILKGHVSLGSLRVRQDRMIVEGVAAPFASSSLASSECKAGLSPGLEFLAQLDPSTQPVEVALARIRQLSAHEVGHAIGFAHNFAASTYGRASVMDYPAPWVKMSGDGQLDLSRAYDVGIGEWDKISVRYSYTEFGGPDAEERGLQAIVQEAIDRDYLFLSDSDARSDGAVDPLANLWDNGAEPVSALRELMKVRRKALDDFGERNLARGRPLALLQNTLAPLYLLHRFQLRAASKMIGGAYLSYALRGDGQKGVQWIDPDDQREALTALLETVRPAALTFSTGLLESLPPLPPGYRDERERFAGFSGPSFDPLAPARIAADMTMGALLQYQRAYRLETLRALDSANPDLSEVIDRILAATWKAPSPSDPWSAALLRVVERSATDHLIGLAGNAGAAPEVRAVAEAKLTEWATVLEDGRAGDRTVDRAHRQAARGDIHRFLNRPAATGKEGRSLPAPPGQPIG